MEVLLIYEQIIEYVLEKIRSGEIKPGEKIMTEKETLRIFNVSCSTVRKAFEQLEKQGYIRSRQGQGRVVEKDIFDKISPVKLNIDENPKIIGVILKNTEFFSRLIKTLEESIMGYGWKMLLMFNDSIEKENYCVRMLINHRVDGIIYVPFRSDYSHSERTFYMLQDSKIPFVVIGKPSKGFNSDAVYSDDEYGSMSIVKQLYERKCERVIHVYDSTGDQMVVEDRKSGFMLGVNRYYNDAEPALFDMSKPEAKGLIDGYLKNAVGKIGINLNSDLVLLRFIDVLNQNGMTPGENIEVIGFEADPQLTARGVNIPSMQIAKEQIARAAVSLIKNKIFKGDKDRVTHKIIFTNLINGYTDAEYGKNF
jgi:DNA-binding LacI/PurR family transcriptional regulator